MVWVCRSAGIRGQQTYGAVMYSVGAFVYDPVTEKYTFDKDKEKAIRALKFLVEYLRRLPRPRVSIGHGRSTDGLCQGGGRDDLGMGCGLGQAVSENPGLLDKMSMFPSRVPTHPSIAQGKL